MRQHLTRPKNLRCGSSSKRLTRDPNTPRTSNDCVVVVLQASASLRDPSVGLRAEAPKSSLRMTQNALSAVQNPYPCAIQAGVARVERSEAPSRSFIPLALVFRQSIIVSIPGSHMGTSVGFPSHSWGLRFARPQPPHFKSRRNANPTTNGHSRHRIPPGQLRIPVPA